MAQPGRKSTASLSVVGVVASVSRIAPPQTLSDDQRGLWLATVNSKPAEWFGDEHIPLLLEYVRHVTTADMLTSEIEAFRPEMFADTDALEKLKTLTTMRSKETSCINALARAMRLTQQSVYRADKAATLANKGAGFKEPWRPV